MTRLSARLSTTLAVASAALGACRAPTSTGGEAAGSASSSLSAAASSSASSSASSAAHAGLDGGVAPSQGFAPAHFSARGCGFSVSLSAEPPRALVGEPVHLVVEVASDCAEPRSVMDGGDTRNALGRANSYHVSLRTLAGAPVPRRSVHDFGGFVGGEPTRAGAPFRKRLLLSHWVTPESPGRYVVSVEKRFDVRPLDWRTVRDGELHEVVVEAPLELVPSTPEALGAIADTLALRALEPAASPDVAREALTALESIVHGRVTPHVGQRPRAKALGDRSLPLEVLATSSTEASLAALERELARASAERGPAWLEARLTLARMLATHASPRSADALWALRADPQGGRPARGRSWHPRQAAPRSTRAPDRARARPKP